MGEYIYWEYGHDGKIYRMCEYKQRGCGVIWYDVKG